MGKRPLVFCGCCRRRASPDKASGNKPQVIGKDKEISINIGKPSSAPPETAASAALRAKESAALGVALQDSELAKMCGAGLPVRELRALRLLCEQSCRGIDYARLGHGFPPQHPTNRLSYREGRHESFQKSAQRSQESRGILLCICLQLMHQPNTAAATIVREFCREIRASDSACQGATFEGVSAALENELLLPLRSLCEGISWLCLTHSKEPLPRAEIEKTVSEITQSVLRNNFKEWRYGNPVGMRQLQGLSEAQVAKWTEATSEWIPLGERNLRIHEDEAHELGLFWATKIGGPSHGFDVLGQCLLPLLANARSKVILISDTSYPHHPVGRAHFKLLWTVSNQPVLWLETVNKDFRAQVDTGTWLSAVLAHAVTKANAMGVMLSCEPKIASELSAAAAKANPSLVPVVMYMQDRLVLRPSNAVVEASDYLSNKHDWLQMAEEVTVPLQRVVYIPPNAPPPAADPGAATATPLIPGFFKSVL